MNAPFVVAREVALCHSTCSSVFQLPFGWLSSALPIQVDAQKDSVGHIEFKYFPDLLRMSTTSTHKIVLLLIGAAVPTHCRDPPVDCGCADLRSKYRSIRFYQCPSEPRELEEVPCHLMSSCHHVIPSFVHLRTFWGKCNDFACDLPADQVNRHCCRTAEESRNHGLLLWPHVTTFPAASL